MQLDKSLSFIGWSFDDAVFDEYLKSLGLLDRPMLEEDFTIFLKNETDGYSLEFTELSTFRETYGPEKQSGVFIFTGIFVYAGLQANGFKKYQGALVMSLSIDSSMAKVRSVLGEPDRTDELGARTEDYWFGKNGMDIVVTGSSDLSSIYSIYFGAVNNY